MRFKELGVCKPKGLSSVKEGTKSDISLRIVGLFDTITMIWTYHVVSTGTWGANRVELTPDLHDRVYSGEYTLNNVKSHGRKFDTQQEAESFVNEFKIKWETASNNTLQEVRDEKLKELTNE